MRRYLLMPRNVIYCILFILGGGLLAAGWYTLMFFDAAVQFLVSHVGGISRTLICARNDIMPCGVMLGYLLVGLGGLLVAIGVGLPPAPQAPEVGAVAGTAPPQSRRLVYGMILGAVALAALGSVLSIRTRPGTWPLFLWLASFVVPVAAMIRIDRWRGTPFGTPFPQRREWAVLLLIVALDLVLVGHDMTHWRWAGTPDETDFFGVAKSIATGASGRPLLGEGGVFTFQPVLSSLYPALFMMVFGVNVFAWKLSSAVALAGSLPFIYLFTRELWSRRAAFMAAVFFGAAPLAVGFSHFGYNNVQVYPIIAGGLGVLAWAHKRQSLLGYYLAGCIAGVGFYTYYAARAVAPLLFVLLWTADGFPLARRARAQTAALTLGVGLTILPIFTDLRTALRNMLLLAASGEQVNVSRILTHWLVSFLHGLWYPGPHHFQSNPINDPICGTLAVIGFWLCVGGWRRANGGFLLAAYVLSTFLVGATSQHERPPLTRLLFLSPLIAVLAAVGGEQLLRALQGTANARERLARVTACVLVGGSVVWSIATLEYSVRYEHHGHGIGTTGELIRIAQPLPAQCHVFFIQVRDTQEGMLEWVMDEYGMRERFTFRRTVDAATIALLRNTPPPLVVFADITPPEQMQEVEEVMAQRFPAGVWQASDPGEMWNLRYLDECGTDRGPSS